jgi:hypothetical protein
MASGAAIVGLDGKGPALKGDLERAASRYEVKFHVLDPADISTYTYDFLQGDPATISNKLIGALIPSATGDSAIYKQLIAGALPYIVGGLQHANRLTIREFQRVLSDQALLAQLARETGDEDLRELAAQSGKDRLLVSAMSGMAGRVRAITAGAFSPLFAGSGPTYSWELTTEPSCTYISLPSLQAVADAAIVAQVMLSDLAQEIGRRQAAIQAGQTLRPLIVILDELTALSASDPQIEQRVLAILLQARSAACVCVVAGQTLPVNPTARQAVLGVGCLLALRVTASDAELLAAEFGTKPHATVTHQIDQGALSGAGTMTVGHAYRINPQHLRAAAIGEAVLCVPPGAPKRVRIAATSLPVPSRLSASLNRLRHPWELRRSK